MWVVLHIGDAAVLLRAFAQASYLGHKAPGAVEQVCGVVDLVVENEQAVVAHRDHFLYVAYGRLRGQRHPFHVPEELAERQDRQGAYL